MSSTHIGKLVFWGRYIDDILLVWDSLHEFICTLNINNQSIVLQCEASAGQVHFLDLTIKVGVEGLPTITYFKETIRNFYLDHMSCHHPSLMKAIPKGHFLKRNCSKIEDFYVQSQILRSRFLEKGYNSRELNIANK